MNKLVGLGIGLTIIFSVLKYLDQIYWPWFWVLSPIWGLAVLVLILCIMFCFFVLLVEFPKLYCDLWEEVKKCMGRVKR